MRNPITVLVEAYLEGRKWQMERMDKELAVLERIAKALERMMKT
jgi:hypothetical protein